MVAVSPAPAYSELGAHRFYLGMAGACALVAFAGFAPTYWMPMWSGTLRVPHIAHVHALFFFTWTLFLTLQAALVATGRTAKHRELGMFGIALATAMVFSGVLLAIHSLTGGIAHGYGEQARAFSIVPLSGIAFFAVVFAFAVANVKRPAVHKRAILLATISLLQAAIARWFMVLLAPPGAAGPPPVQFTIAPGLVSDLLIVAAVVHDWRTRGRPHPVYVIGGTCLLALQVLRVPACHTAAGLAIADWFAALAT